MGASMSNTNTPSTIGKPPLKAIGIAGTTGKKTQKDVLRRLKKSLIITLLLRIQNLHISAWTDPFKDLLFEKLREFKELFQYFNKGMLELLKYYGDPDTLISENNLDPALDIVAIPETAISSDHKESPYQSSTKASKLQNSKSRSLINNHRRSTPTE